MKYKCNEMISAEGAVFEKDKEYDGEEFPVAFFDAWLEASLIEKAKKEAKPKDK